MSILNAQRILILDDEPLIALAIEEFLYDFGVGEVKIALKCEAARECIFNAWPTFVILDVYLPDGSGYDIADILSTKGICFVFSAGVADTEIPQRFRGRPVLGKPLDYGDLSQIIYQAASREYATSS